MSTILATELFQARRDAALATSKLLLENSCYELRNAPLMPNLYLTIKSRKLPRVITKPNSKASWHLPQPIQTYNNQRRLIRLQQSHRPKSQSQSLSSGTRKDSKRSGNTKQFPSFKHASIFHKVLKSNPFHCLSYHDKTFQWEEGWPTLWINRKS